MELFIIGNAVIFQSLNLTLIKKIDLLDRSVSLDKPKLHYGRAPDQ